MANRTIKFTVIAKRWFDRVNGNTYHSVRCVRHKDGAIIVGPFQYGYGEAYRDTALRLMGKSGWLPKKYGPKPGFNNTWWLYERDNNYPILWQVSDGLKRDCVANGKLED